MQKTLGGDRLGSGSRMRVDLRNYERATFNLGYVWRSTMASGTLVPFMSEVALPADTFDINLDVDVLTHPTVGPLFGSYKVQLDTFLIPIRLYNALLHNNMLGIGMNMSQVKLPIIEMTALPLVVTTADEDISNSQINPSSLLAYLGIRGVGYVATGAEQRTFNAVPILAYWEIYKNYYANKMEEVGAVLHTPSLAIVNTVDDIEIFMPPSTTTILPFAPASGVINVNTSGMITINYTPPAGAPIPNQIIVTTLEHGDQSLDALSTGVWTYDNVAGTITAPFRGTFWGATTLIQWRYTDANDINTGKPEIVTFPLSNIDEMRNNILSNASTTSPYNIDANPLAPYEYLAAQPNGVPNVLSSQEGLGLKTYQSDLFNNWLNTEWIDGPSGVNAITAIDTSSGSFTIDTLLLSRKVYDLLNRIAISGGSYNDWIDAVYVHEGYRACESPMYMGGLIRELVFQEVVSNSQSAEQPLGTLAGKGTMAGKRKGGSVYIKVDEPSYIMGIVSLTPRVDYSQGNKWDVHLQTLDDLHKPQLDEIGFQELVTEQMAWWDTSWNSTTSQWETKSAGKQPAWINYMTNVNRTYGNFAIQDNEMFMTLNRRYERDNTTLQFVDLTTYIDPSKFNFIFAETALDAQNFWVQIAVDITARRKVSAKQIPNL